MSLYLKEFNNHAAYEAAKSGLILPNVSICTQENEVHYKPFVDPSGGHPYVEIGGTKWATMNIGSSSITDKGLIFQWGDTQGYTAAQIGSGDGQKAFSWADYKYSDNGSSSVMTKYNSTDGKSVLEASDDAVTAAWGGSWRMPTTEEFQALGTATTSALTEDYEGSGVAGLVLTSNADGSKKLFFPTCHYVYEDMIYDSTYWLSSLDTDFGCRSACYLCFCYDDMYLSINNRCYGFPVRGVLAE